MQLLKITITEKDLNKVKPIWKSDDGKEYPHTFSPSGMLIDELAYAIGQWTSEDLFQNNLDYEPNEPYQYNYEADLFEATKTLSQLKNVTKGLGTVINEGLFTKIDLQAGAYCALHIPQLWNDILVAYTEKLQFERTEGISKAYNEQLQKEIDSFHDDLRKEWLYGDRDCIGIIKEIKKYFEAESVEYSDKENDTFVFFFDKEQAKDTLENYDGEKLTVKNYTAYILTQIVEASKAREYKDKQEREKRKIERERLATYKKGQATQAEANRRAKLLSMTN